VQPIVLTQGGAVFVNGHGDNLRITNNLVLGNGGTYGAVRLGTPNIPSPDTDNHNDNVKVLHNRFVANGSTNLAGAIGVFAGADAYEIAYNDICGNGSMEYGGGISHYGLSRQIGTGQAALTSSIHHNRIYFNSSYDEGGGIMIAGELPVDPSILSPGAGPVNIYNNMIANNLSNDDGGGLRFLMAGTFQYNVVNNMIVNNVSTHEGGGISMNDATNVRIFNNTIMKNITTATAMTSNGLPAPAGIASSRNSNLLQATLPAGSRVFSNPILFNNILWDNRAGTWTGNGVSGIGMEGDPAAVFNWDLGLADGSGTLTPRYSLLQTLEGGNPAATNLIGQDPMVVGAYDTGVRIYPWRGNPNLVGANIVAVDMPEFLSANYHLTSGSPAINLGRAVVGSVTTARPDFDGDTRYGGTPSATTPVDAGADEFTGTPGLPAAVAPASLAVPVKRLTEPAAPPVEGEKPPVIPGPDVTPTPTPVAPDPVISLPPKPGTIPTPNATIAPKATATPKP
jgi:hypothetical protein